jgi:hypothetical protein
MTNSAVRALAIRVLCYFSVDVRQTYRQLTLDCRIYKHSTAGALNLFCAIGPFESLVKPTDPFSQKCM